MGLIYSMEIYSVPERRMYWSTQDSGIFPAMNFGKYMPRNRFEAILRYLSLSNDADRNKQFSDFLDAVNARLKTTLSPGDNLCMDESIVEAWHKKLKAKKGKKKAKTNWQRIPCYM